MSTQEQPPQFTKMQPLTPEQIKLLQRIYPDVAPTLGMTQDQVWFAAGQADVVRKLTEHTQKYGVK